MASRLASPSSLAVPFWCTICGKYDPTTWLRIICSPPCSCCRLLVSLWDCCDIIGFRPVRWPCTFFVWTERTFSCLCVRLTHISVHLFFFFFCWNLITSPIDLSMINSRLCGWYLLLLFRHDVCSRGYSGTLQQDVVTLLHSANREFLVVVSTIIQTGTVSTSSLAASEPKDGSDAGIGLPLRCSPIQMVETEARWHRVSQHDAHMFVFTISGTHAWTRPVRGTINVTSHLVCSWFVMPLLCGSILLRKLKEGGYRRSANTFLLLFGPWKKKKGTFTQRLTNISRVSHLQKFISAR